jgi:hypothetical protein
VKFCCIVNEQNRRRLLGVVHPDNKRLMQDILITGALLLVTIT